MADHPHTGHRKRMMEKFRRFGMDIFADHEVLEILLFFAMRQGDTNPTAHRLLERFGSLHAVLEAPAEQLEEVAGVGPHTADLIKTVYAMIGRYRADVSKSERYSDRLNTYERVGEYFAPQLARGGHAHVAVDPYKIARGALLCHAAGVAIAHNHPTGAARPSEADILVTNQLRQTLAGLDLELIDHCVVARGKYVSIGKMQNIEIVKSMKRRK